MTRREAARARELADQGALARLWRLGGEAGQIRVLGLFRAADAQQLHAILDSLPMLSWMTVETALLSLHPRGPAGASVS